MTALSFIVYIADKPLLIERAVLYVCWHHEYEWGDKTVNSEQPLFLGIDGGGSKCRALILDAKGKELGVGISGTANLLRGVENSKCAIMEAYEQARIAAGLQKSASTSIIAGMGIAGANLPHLKQALLDWRHPFAQLRVTSDLEIACLAAHKRFSGGVVIIGTGSCGLLVKDEQPLAFGGHGFLLGDKGSGAWFGLRAVQSVLEAFSGTGPDSRLVPDILKKAGVNSALGLVSVYSTAAPKQFAELAPLVFELAVEDPVAKAIVNEGVAYIEQLCLQILQHQPERFSFIGGLSGLIAQRLPRSIQEEIKPALTSPEQGAILFAQLAEASQ